jgi:AcrR family transcriptional regulator
MDPTKYVIDKSEKVQLIIEASQKRFGLFGVEKTSMREIADDLNLSKASLYYYFPDKESLYRAVVEKEQEEFISKISERIFSFHEPEQLLLEYATARLASFRTLLNLGRLRFEAFSGMKPGLKETIQVFREKEKSIIINIFVKGIERGIFHINDAEQMASLFLDLLKGLRISLINEKETLFIEQHEYEMLLDKTLVFTTLFIRGLKCTAN